MIELKLSLTNPSEERAVNRLDDILRVDPPANGGRKLPVSLGGQLVHKPPKNDRGSCVLPSSTRANTWGKASADDILDSAGLANSSIDRVFHLRTLFV